MSSQLCVQNNTRIANSVPGQERTQYIQYLFWNISFQTALSLQFNETPHCGSDCATSVNQQIQLSLILPHPICSIWPKPWPQTEYQAEIPLTSHRDRTIWPDVQQIPQALWFLASLTLGYTQQACWVLGVCGCLQPYLFPSAGPHRGSARWAHSAVEVNRSLMKKEAWKVR